MTAPAPVITKPAIKLTPDLFTPNGLVSLLIRRTTTFTAKQATDYIKGFTGCDLPWLTPRSMRRVRAGHGGFVDRLASVVQVTQPKVLLLVQLCNNP